MTSTVGPPCDNYTSEDVYMLVQSKHHKQSMALLRTTEYVFTGKMGVKWMP